MYDETTLQALDYHLSMLLDEKRTTSFLRAIIKTVKLGDIVLDMGCGTGILSYFACMAGARRVYAIEKGPIIDLAKAICQHNGFQDRVVFFNDWSTKIDLPESVDVIITETIGSLGFEEGILGWIIDAKKRFLNTGGQVIPRSLELVLVPTENPEYQDYVDSWSPNLYSLDFSPARSMAVNNLLWAKWTTTDLFLSEPASLVNFDLMDVESTDFSGQISFIARRDGLLHGLGGWFSAELTPGLTISNTPPELAPSWNQTFLPIERPLLVRTGDRLDIEVAVRDNAAHWEWRVILNRSTNEGTLSNSTTEFVHNSRMGKLGSNQHPRSPDFMPVRTEKAEVDLLILGLMDGATPLSEIAHRAVAAYPVYFSSYERALEYASNLSDHYAGWTFHKHTQKT